MERTFLALGALSGGLAVAAGAFGAHGMRGRLSPELMAVFETAARYQMYHALALIGVAAVADRLSGRGTEVTGWLFVAGTVLFSGSLYLLALGGPPWLGAVTPLGGLSFIAGWATLAWSALCG